MPGVVVYHRCTEESVSRASQSKRSRSGGTAALAGGVPLDLFARRGEGRARRSKPAARPSRGLGAGFGLEGWLHASSHAAGTLDARGYCVLDAGETD